LDFGKGGVQFSGVSFGGGFVASSTILVWVCCSGDSTSVVGFFRRLFQFDYGGDSVGVVWAVSRLWCYCVVVIWLRWWFSVGSMGLLWFWFGWGWWIILDSDLVLEQFAEDVKWCDWC
jgi:hypothetical protein